MQFISEEDNSDSVLNWNESDIAFANDFLLAKAKGLGLAEEEILLPPRNIVKRLGCAVACRECAIGMIGNDPTIMVNGGRQEDIYMQKYEVYRALIKDLSSSLSYADFAIEGTSAAGKGGVGTIRLSRG